MNTGLKELLDSNRARRRQRTMYMLYIWGGILGIWLLSALSRIFGGSDMCHYILAGTPDEISRQNHARCVEQAGADRRNLILVTLATMTIAGTIGTLLLRRHRDPLGYPAARLLLDRPDDIVWIYPFHSRVKLLGMTVRTVKSILLQPAKGEVEQLFLGKSDDERKALSVLAAHLPGVAVGYTDAFYEQFRRDPQGLRTARKSAQA